MTGKIHLGAIGDVIPDKLPITDDDMTAYLAVCEEALQVHLEKEAVRHALWKQYSATDQLQMIKIKTERAMHSAEYGTMGTVVTAEVPDIINYAIFAHRIVNERI